MKAELTQAEVRLFYPGRTDWDTVYFTAKGAADMYNQAKKIAKDSHAAHFNCSVVFSETSNSVPARNRKP
jgi:hypothetical protein